MRSTVRIVLFLVLPIVLPIALLAGCGGGEAPSLSDITLSKLSVRRGEEVFATVRASDPDGDLDRARIDIGVRSDVDDDVELDRSVYVSEVAPGTTATSLIVGFTLYGALPLGNYTLALAVHDNDDNGSEQSTVHFRCTQ